MISVSLLYLLDYTLPCRKVKHISKNFSRPDIFRRHALHITHRKCGVYVGSPLTRRSAGRARAARESACGARSGLCIFNWTRTTHPPRTAHIMRHSSYRLRLAFTIHQIDYRVSCLYGLNKSRSSTTPAPLGLSTLYRVKLYRALAPRTRLMRYIRTL